MSDFAQFRPGEARVSRGSDTTTAGWRITVTPGFEPEQSSPEDRLYVFGYRVRITNGSAERARLVSRHWDIVDANGSSRVVEGEGVIGRQPDLAPGETHEYESFCPLTTSWGTMEGWYTMARADGTSFRITIGRFYFVAPATPART